MEEVKSSSKIILRSKNSPTRKPKNDPFMIISSVGCLSAIYLKSQFALFGFLLVLLSLFLVSKKKSFGLNSITPLYGLMPSLVKVTLDVFRCLLTGEPL